MCFLLSLNTLICIRASSFAVWQLKLFVLFFLVATIVKFTLLCSITKTCVSVVKSISHHHILRGINAFPFVVGRQFSDSMPKSLSVSMEFYQFYVQNSFSYNDMYLLIDQRNLYPNQTRLCLLPVASAICSTPKQTSKLKKLFQVQCLKHLIGYYWTKEKASAAVKTYIFIQIFHIRYSECCIHENALVLRRHRNTSNKLSATTTTTKTWEKLFTRSGRDLTRKKLLRQILEP